LQAEDVLLGGGFHGMKLQRFEQSYCLN
jgi:hypothetical protein